MHLAILYEDEDIVVVDKPAGVMTHPDGRNDEETVSDWFLKMYPNAGDVGETQMLPNGTSISRPGIVHRLDRDTSGVLVLAKTKEAHAFLKDAFQKHEVHKTYLAAVYGVPKEQKGIIDFSIGRSRKDFRLRSAQPKAKGTLREALTRYEVISDIKTHALLKVMPETGRTHQIRVHLKAIHHPIVGDTLYAPHHPLALGASRLALHAYLLDIPLMNGTRITCAAPVPEDLVPVVRHFPGVGGILARE